MSCPKLRCQHDNRDGDEQLIFLPLQFSGRHPTCRQSLLDGSWTESDSEGHDRDIFRGNTVQNPGDKSSGRSRPLKVAH
jgi:hypothetical protein